MEGELGEVAMALDGRANGDYGIMSDGFSAAALFKQGFSYTYDDLIFHPGYINFAVDDVDLATSLTRNITLRTPCVSSPMDTVAVGAEEEDTGGDGITA